MDHVRLGRRPSVRQCIGVNERQILALFGVKSRRESAARFIVVLNSGGSAMNIRYRVDLSDMSAHNSRRCSMAANTRRARSSGRRSCWRPTLVSVTTCCKQPLGQRIDGLPNQAALYARQPGAGAQRGGPSGGNPQAVGQETALLIATACSSPPKGRKRWTLDLLAGAMVRLTEHEGVSRETVRRRLSEDDLKSAAAGYVVHSAGRWHLCRADGGRA